jgi:murein DD-endopeptidase MepM/ murein hydrolase activator NlpD
MRFAFSLAASSALVLFASFASADVQHVVGKGHTIEAISNRYHVPVKTIIEANHLKDVKHLKPGDVLTIPKADAKEKVGEKKDAKAKLGTKEPVSFVAKPKTPGVVHLKRISIERRSRPPRRGRKRQGRPRNAQVAREADALTGRGQPPDRGAPRRAARRRVEPLR